MHTTRDQIVRLLFGALAISALALAGYVIYLQASTPALDCDLDWTTGRVLAAPQDSFANYAGLQPGDVILTVEGVAFQQWRSREIENRAVTIRRGDQTLDLELPILPLALVNLSNLISALIVWLAFWILSVYLVWRRWRELAARLFFLMTQIIGVGLLFFLAYPQAINRPAWMAILISVTFHLAGALLVHYYLIFPVPLGTARQRAWTLAAIYPGMLLALACRLFLGDLGLRLSFLYNTFEISGAIALSIYSYLRRATPDGRRRLRLVIGGNLAAALPAFAFYLLPTILGARRMPDWIVGPLILISPLSYFLAIVRDNLFHIDRVLNRTIVYVILSLGILILYLGPFFLIYRFAPGDWLAQMMIAAALTLLVGFAFEWSRVQVQRWVDRFFYGGWYDYPRVVETISAALARSIERAQLSDVLTHQVPELMRLTIGALSIGEAPALPLSSSPTLEFPLTFQNETRALWRVGARRDDEDWSDTDRRILATLARQAEVALGNVLLVEMLRQQLDVIRATQHQLLRSREAERARLARDLHDGPIQDLVGLNMQIGLLLGDLPGFQNLEGLKSIRAEVRDLLSELRQVCAELRPPMLDTIGLSAALRVLADEWSSQHGIPVQLDLAPDASVRALPGEVAVNLYRVAQEALSNITRHAHAHTVALHLAFDGARLALMIRDDGRGFNAPATLHDLPARGHFGLVGLRERVELIGGALAIESEPGKGAGIRVEWSDR
jgi:signal transduction histidine kinase